jgi:tape measure domain-containing protein
MVTAAAGALAALGASRIGGWGIRLAAEAESAQAAFSVLVGSAELATKTLGDLRQFAAESPFTFSGLQSNARTLLAFGITAEELLPTIKMLGDISGGNAQRMEMLSLAFAQMSAAGRLMGQDLLQMVNAGFNPLQQISAETGISLVDLKKKMEEGAISSDMVRAAFQRATAEGGKFHGMIETASQTLSGRWAQLIGQVELLAMKFGNELLPVLGRGIDVLSGLAKWANELDAAFVQNTIQLVAMAAAFTATMMLVPRIITLVGTLIKAFRAMATAQAIAMAFGGPAGWAALAVSLAVAAGAGWAVSKMFDEQSASIVATNK